MDDYSQYGRGFIKRALLAVAMDLGPLLFPRRYCIKKVDRCMLQKRSLSEVMYKIGRC